MDRGWSTIRGLCLLNLLCLLQAATAGSLNVPGQGARAVAMGGAFTAVADDPAAIYYNPAGIARLDGTRLQAGAMHGRPEIRYRVPGAGLQRDGKAWLGPSLFLTHQFTDRLSGGIGIYTPYARDAEFSADPVSGFAAQHASIYRVDTSPVLAYRLTPQLSVSGGAVFAYSEAEQSLPVSPVSRIVDNLGGWAVGAVAGVLYVPNDQLRLGLTWRSRMNTDYSGRRQVLSPGPPLQSRAWASGRWPASAAAGIAWLPSPNLKLAIDANWTGWSYVDKVVTHTDTLGSATTLLEQRDSWDLRAGTEWRFLPGWFLRGGYSRITHSTPSRRIIPPQPDADGYALDLGIGRTTGHWTIDAVYEYADTDTVHATDNAYGYTGDFHIRQHLLGVTAGYRF